MKNKFLIIGIKKKFNLILPNYSMILPNPSRNIMIDSLLFKFSLEEKIYKRKIPVILKNDPDYHKKYI
jgi:hypothetical protein